MSSILIRSARALPSPQLSVQRAVCRGFATSQSEPSSSSTDAPNTHFKITLRRSAISLGDAKKGTLKALGLHRRHQTVFHRHTPEAAGKILSIKELLEVENVPTHMVRSKEEMREERKASRGYEVVSSRRGSFLNL